MNKLGGGLKHYDEYKSDEMVLFGGGMRSNNDVLVRDKLTQQYALHDKMSYSRGTVMHSRSPANQFMNFHYLYGGPKKFFFDRFFYQVLYKRIFRAAGIPLIVTFSR